MNINRHTQEELCFYSDMQNMTGKGVNPVMFHSLVKDKNLRVIRKMIQQKVDLNQPGISGYTPLMIASLSG